MEFAQPGERRRREETDGVSPSTGISRRVFLTRGLVGASFVALGGKLWQMQIAEGGEYERVAKDNVLRFQRLKAPRGRIIDRNGVPLAVSRRAWTVSVVPSRLPEDEAERQAVLDELAATLQLKEALVLERASLPVGSDAAVANELAKRLNLRGTDLLASISSSDATIVMLKDELSPEDANALLQSCQDLPGVRVMNSLDYELEIHAFEDIALPIKKDVDPDLALNVAANELYLPGVVVDDSTLIRQYPGGPPFAHILGYVGPINGEEWEAAQTESGTPIYDQDDVVGRNGIEEAMEASLRGAKGGRWTQVDSSGVERFELLERRREPTSGLSVQLTINKAFQELVVQILQEGIQVASIDAVKAGNKAVQAGVAIAMDPRNGEVIAMASLPTYDNQLFVDGISQEQYDKYLDPKAADPLLDRATKGLFPPGSTLKPLLACAGLQEGVITTDKKFKCTGRIRVPWSWDETQGNDYPCWQYDVGHGEVDIYQGIAQSCDIYFYNVGAPKQKPEEPANADYVHYYDQGDTQTRHYFEGLGIDRIERYLKEAFGFGMQTGIEIADEEEGLVPNPKWLFQSNLNEYWSVGDTINVSIGQGHLLCTPLQLLNGTVRIANSGTLWKPRLVKALLDDEGNVVEEFKPVQLTPQPITDQGLATVNQEHMATVREGMRLTVTEGTAKDQITFTDPIIGAKTGTAEFGEAIDGRYTEGHAWFSAFAPYENPEIAVVVLVVGGRQGSVYAGPIGNKILDAYFHTPGMRTV